MLDLYLLDLLIKMTLNELFDRSTLLAIAVIALVLIRSHLARRCRKHDR